MNGVRPVPLLRPTLIHVRTLAAIVAPDWPQGRDLDVDHARELARRRAGRPTAWTIRVRLQSSGRRPARSTDTRRAGCRRPACSTSSRRAQGPRSRCRRRWTAYPKTVPWPFAEDQLKAPWKCETSKPWMGPLVPAPQNASYLPATCRRPRCFHRSRSAGCAAGWTKRSEARGTGTDRRTFIPSRYARNWGARSELRRRC